MDANSFDSIFNLITLFCGFYCLYYWFQLGRKGLDMPKCPLVPASQDPSECMDAEAYVAYMRPRMLVLGIVVLISAVLGMLEQIVFDDNVWIQIAIIVLPMAVLVWFCICFAKARKEYW